MVQVEHIPHHCLSILSSFASSQPTSQNAAVVAPDSLLLDGIFQNLGMCIVRETYVSLSATKVTVNCLWPTKKDTRHTYRASTISTAVDIRLGSS